MPPKEPNDNNDSNHSNNSATSNARNADSAEPAASSPFYVALNHLLSVLHVAFDNDGDSRQISTSVDEEDPLEEARRCKLCRSSQVKVVYIPCGHLVACLGCGTGVDACLVCGSEVRSTVEIRL